MLQTVDLGRERLLHGRQPVRVRGHRQAVPMGLLDEERQLLARELRAQDVRPRGGHAATGHHLDDVDAAVGAFPHRSGDGVPPLDLAAHVVAVAVRARQRRAGCEDRGLRPHATAALPVAVLDGDPVPVTEIADRRHAGGQLALQRLLDDARQLLG